MIVDSPSRGEEYLPYIWGFPLQMRSGGTAASKYRIRMKISGWSSHSHSSDPSISSRVGSRQSRRQAGLFPFLLFISVCTYINIVHLDSMILLIVAGPHTYYLIIIIIIPNVKCNIICRNKTPDFSPSFHLSAFVINTEALFSNI